MCCCCTPVLCVVLLCMWSLTLEYAGAAWGVQCAVWSEQRTVSRRPCYVSRGRAGDVTRRPRPRPAARHSVSTWRARASTRPVRDQLGPVGPRRRAAASHWPRSARALHPSAPRTSNARGAVYSSDTRLTKETALEWGRETELLWITKETLTILNEKIIRMSTVLDVCGPLSPPSTPPLMDVKVSVPLFTMKTFCFFFNNCVKYKFIFILFFIN